MMPRRLIESTVNQRSRAFVDSAGFGNGGIASQRNASGKYEGQQCLAKRRRGRTIRVAVPLFPFALVQHLAVDFLCLLFQFSELQLPSGSLAEGFSDRALQLAVKRTHRTGRCFRNALLVVGGVPFVPSQSNPSLRARLGNPTSRGMGVALHREWRQLKWGYEKSSISENIPFDQRLAHLDSRNTSDAPLPSCP